MQRFHVLSVALALVLGLVAQGAAAQTRVVVLGTGTPNADPDRSGPAVAVIVGERSYLVDAGPGIVRRAAAAAKKGFPELEASELQRVFVTHLHSDHTTGLPDLLLTPWVLERSEPLRVTGPPGIAAMMDSLKKAYAEDIRMRLYGLEPANTTGYEAVVQETRGGLVYEDEWVKVDAIAVPHGSWPVSLAYRFRTADLTIVVSGDTGPSEELAAAARGCDVLVHEVYAQSGWETRPPAWQRYHTANHTSTAELGKLAREIQPKLLVLYHQLYWGATDEDLVSEVSEYFDGPVVSANDLDVFPAEP